MSLTETASSRGAARLYSQANVQRLLSGGLCLIALSFMPLVASDAWLAASSVSLLTQLP